MGITVRGIYNDDDSFDIDYYYPYFTGSEKTTNEIIDIESTQRRNHMQAYVMTLISA